MRHIVGLGLAAVVLAAAPAAAFPWMVRHNYASCAACHVDPSGGGQLTPYGRAQSDVLLRFKVTKPTPEEEASMEPAPTTRFLWFANLPDWLNLSGNIRDGIFIRPAATTMPVIPLIMALDAYATVNVDRFVGHLTAGVAIKRGEKASLFPSCDPTTAPGGQCGVQAVMREAWLGAKFADEAVMIRAGRMNLPFGLRNNEHYMWVRDKTITDINTGQQLGASVAYNGELLRGELMGIAGNFSVGPDLYRERGYSGFLEYSVRPNFFLGLSSLIAHAGASLSTGKETTRHVHGMTLRWSPTPVVAILTELDLLAWQSPGAIDRVGFVGMIQSDFEVWQGLHLIATVEGLHEGTGASAPSVGGWASVQWNALPHVEFRVDGIFRELVTATGASPDISLLVQAHVFL